MIWIPDSRLDGFLAEDLPYIDLTTQVLGLGDRAAEIAFFTRVDCVLCGTEEVRRMLGRLDPQIEILEALPSGSRIEAGTVFLRARGSAEALHAGWKVCLNMFDHLSAVATKTRGMVDAIVRANPRCQLLCTRKSMPGVKDLLLHAVMTGGAYPHRLGLSETVLVFENHLRLMGGFDAFVAALPQIRARCYGKKLFVEADASQARILAGAGVDGIQLDKLSASELPAVVQELRGLNPQLTLLAAGGIKPDNAGAYAATGVDGLVTTSVYTAPPCDMSARISPA